LFFCYTLGKFVVFGKHVDVTILRFSFNSFLKAALIRLQKTFISCCAVNFKFNSLIDSAAYRVGLKQISIAAICLK